MNLIKWIIALSILNFHSLHALEYKSKNFKKSYAPKKKLMKNHMKSFKSKTPVTSQAPQGPSTLEFDYRCPNTVHTTVRQGQVLENNWTVTAVRSTGDMTNLRTARNSGEFCNDMVKRIGQECEVKSNRKIGCRYMGSHERNRFMANVQNPVSQVIRRGTTNFYPETCRLVANGHWKCIFKSR